MSEELAKLKSPQANLFLSISDRLFDQVKELRFIDQDLGQLEHYGMRPAVELPCCLIDITATTFSDLQNDTTQLAEGVVIVRTALLQLSNSSNLTPTQWRQKALTCYETEQGVYEALHGWAAPGFSKLLRRSASTEQRDDDIRVRMLEFSYSYTDESTKPKTVKFTRPAITIGS